MAWTMRALYPEISFPSTGQASGGIALPSTWAQTCETQPNSLISNSKKLEVLQKAGRFHLIQSVPDGFRMFQTSPVV